MLKDSFLPFVNDLLDATDAQIEFISKLLIGDSVIKPSPEDRSVSLRVRADDPFIQQLLDLRPGYFLDHRLTFPVPLQFGQVFSGFLLLFFSTLTLMR